MSQRLQRPVKDHRLVEKLTAGEFSLVRGVLTSHVLSNDWAQTWAEVANDRLALARAHLDVAESIAVGCRAGDWDPAGRSVISRAYYSMFFAVRAAVALEIEADENDHRKLPPVLDKTTTLGPTVVRVGISCVLGRFRAARNDADYSAYYPRSLEVDGSDALAAGRTVLCQCEKWVVETKRKRGLG